MSAPTTVPVDEGGSGPAAPPRPTTTQGAPPVRTAPPYTGPVVVGTPVVVAAPPVRRNPDGSVYVQPPPPGSIYPGTSGGGLTPVGYAPTYDPYRDRPRYPRPPVYDEPEDNGMMPLVTLALLSSMSRGKKKKKKKDRQPQVIVIQAPPTTGTTDHYQPYAEDQQTTDKELRIGVRNNQSLVKK